MVKYNDHWIWIREDSASQTVADIIWCIVVETECWSSKGQEELLIYMLCPFCQDVMADLSTTGPIHDVIGQGS